MNYHWNWGILFAQEPGGTGTYLHYLLVGLLWTLATALAAWVIALLIGSAVGTLRTTSNRWVVRLGNAYVEVFRNVPLLVQMFLWFFVVPELLPTGLGNWVKQMPPPWGSYLPAVLCLGLFTSIRVAEQVKAGIQSLPRGQGMAGTAMGLTAWQTYRYVILPQALRIIMPPLTSEFMNVIKNSSVALTIGLMELTGRARAMQEFSFQVFEAYAAATVIYLLTNLVVVLGMRWLEGARARARPHRRGRRPGRGALMGGFDWDVIRRSLPYLFRDGMTFTVTLTVLAMTGGIIFGTLLAMMRLASFRPLALLAGGYVNLMRSIPLVLVIFWFFFLVPYIGAWILREPRPISVGAVLLGARHLHDVRGRVLLRDHARRHPVDPARPGVVGLRAGPRLLADHGAHRAAAGLPQHAAGAAHPDHHPVPGHLARVRDLGHRLPGCRLQDRQPGLPPRRDVLVRGRGLLRHLVRPVALGEAAAGENRGGALMPALPNVHR